MECETVTQDHGSAPAPAAKPTQLTLQNAIAKLHMFFDQFARHGWGALLPKFEYTQVGEQAFTATVTLPECVSLRTVESPPSPRKKDAKAQAAMKALQSLQEAGLMTPDYLPSEMSLLSKPESVTPTPVKGTLQDCDPQLNPWKAVGAAWTDSKTLWETVICVTRNTEQLRLRLFSPVPLPAVQPFNLYWSESLTYKGEVAESVQIPFTEMRVRLLRRVSDIVLNSFHSQLRLTPTSDYLILVGPDLPLDELEAWCKQNESWRPGEEALAQSLERNKVLVRRKSKFGALFLFQEWLPENRLEALPFSKRRDFLHAGQWLGLKQDSSQESDPFSSQETAEPDKAVFIDASDCTVDNIDAAVAQVALFLPSFFHKIQISLLADALCKDILSPLHLDDLQLVISAISAPASYNDTNYQNLEFIGDSVLKYIVGVHIFFERSEAKEGELVKLKDTFVSNSRLAQAALNAGLDKYIISRQFTGKKWQPWTISSISDVVDDRRRLGPKVLADVVEALIGAAYLNGGFSEAVACAKMFLPEVHSLPREERFEVFQPDMVPRRTDMMADLEQLLGYTFRNPALAMEALTHPSYKPLDHEICSGDYQRLEFLGDTVLDMIVVKQFTRADLLHWDNMHKWKSVSVNLEFLSFLCLETFLTKQTTEVHARADGSLAEDVSVSYLPLWAFMRFSSEQIEESQHACMQRHLRLRKDLFERLSHDSHYPWTEFDALNPDKFYSDIVESVVGAVYIDSGGDLSQCEMLVERFGVLHYLRRFVSSQVECLHPKTRLGQWKGMFGRIKYKSGQDEAGFWCTVTLDGVDKATCRGCASSEEAISRVSEAFLAMLGEEKHSGKRKGVAPENCLTLVQEPSGVKRPDVGGHSKNVAGEEGDTRTPQQRNQE